jgi:DNA invertase Pin-like site-specific DNA recombinase
MKAALYLRVSSEEQNADNQLPSLLKVAESRGWEVYKVYSEEASAWQNGHQSELKALLKDASTHNFQVVLVWALDRLTREGISTILGYVNTLRQYGVTLVSLQEPWTEQSGPMAELLFALTAWVARFESERKSQRIKAALARRKAKGLPVGRKLGAKDAKPRKRTGYLLRFNERRR